MYWGWKARVAIMFAGFVVGTIGARETIVVLAGILLALALCGTASRSVRTVPRLAETTE